LTDQKEQTVSIVKAYSVGNPDSLVFVIPKELQEQIQCNPKGKKYLVKFDEKKRIIYEPVEDAKLQQNQEAPASQ
jgi:hypothetical protein